MTSTRVLLAIVLAATCAAPAWAARVSGVVVDAAGRPVELANVRVAAHRAGAVTDAQGAFSLEQSIDELAEKLKLDPLEYRDKIDPNDARRAERRIGADKIGW